MSRQARDVRSGPRTRAYRPSSPHPAPASLATEALAPGYARTPASGWTPGEDGAFRADGALEWPAPQSCPVLEWLSDGRSTTFPGANGLANGLMWPAVAAVGLCEGADGPVVAWTSRFILPGESLPAASPGSGLRITGLQLTLFDRSRIAQTG